MRMLELKQDLIKILQSKQQIANKFYSIFISNLITLPNQESLIYRRKKCLEFLLLNLKNYFRSETLEMTYNLVHVCLLLEERINNYFNSYDRSLDYFFFTSLFIITKINGNSYKIVKELLIEYGLDYNTVLMIEILLLNYTNWNICLFSIEEIIEIVAHIIEIPKEEIVEFLKECEDYKEYILSEYEIYKSNNLFTISLTVISSVLKDKYGEKSQINSNFIELVNQLEIDIDLINLCEIQIIQLLKIEDQINENLFINHDAITSNAL